MSYGRSFGMRSFENIVRDGRFRTPVGTKWPIGTAVTLDPDNPGLLKLATNAQAPSQACGVAIFEHIQMQGIDAVLNTSDELNFVPGGRYSQMAHGQGAKVWFRNTPDKVLYDGRTQDNAALLLSSMDLTGLKPGNGLTPDGAGLYKKATDLATAWLIVEQVNPSTGLVEARFTF